MQIHTIQQTPIFAKWLSGLRDLRAKARILARLKQAEHGNLGDVKTVGDGVLEMRVDVGPGYRLYYTRRHEALIILLVGGDKRAQQRDIQRAIEMAKDCETWLKN
jgi:putative addiction module killer protein